MDFSSKLMQHLQLLLEPLIGNQKGKVEGVLFFSYFRKKELLQKHY